MAALARRHFARWNGGLLDRPDVRLVVDDGRRHLGATGETFDVIVSDLFIPWHASAGNLYSLEMYRTVARRLAPGGLFCQWLPHVPAHAGGVRGHRPDVPGGVSFHHAVAKRLLSRIGRCSAWSGAQQPITVDLERVGRRLAAMPVWGRDSLLGAPRSIGMLYVGDLSAAPDLIARGSLNLDGRP